MISTSTVLTVAVLSELPHAQCHRYVQITNPRQEPVSFQLHDAAGDGAGDSATMPIATQERVGLEVTTPRALGREAHASPSRPCSAQVRGVSCFRALPSHLSAIDQHGVYVVGPKVVCVTLTQGSTSGFDETSTSAATVGVLSIPDDRPSPYVWPASPARIRKRLNCGCLLAPDPLTTRLR